MSGSKKFRMCCACGDPYPQPPYHVLPSGGKVCLRCCERVTMILRGILIKIQEESPTESKAR